MPVRHRAASRTYYELGDAPVDVDAGGQYALLAVPYLHSADVDRLIQNLFSALTRAQAQTGWAAYDPQLGRPVDLAANRAAVTEMFRDTIAVRDEFA